jgi:hypothetical protein
MPRPRGGSHNKRNSTVLGVRLPNEEATAIYAAAGADHGSLLAEWLRLAIAQALRKGVELGAGGAQMAGYEEGKAQGWAHANKVFREALVMAVTKLQK